MQTGECFETETLPVLPDSSGPPFVEPLQWLLPPCTIPQHLWKQDQQIPNHQLDPE